MKKTILSLTIAAFGIALMTGCAHEHIPSATSCLEPVVCMQCGEQLSPAPGHAYPELEQTCGVQRTCSRCGEVDNENIAHTTNVGVCEKCGKEVNVEWSKKLWQALKDGNDASLEAYKQFEIYPDDANQAATESLVYFKKEKESYQKAKMLCGNYAEVSTLKTNLDKLCQVIPTEYNVEDADSINHFFENITTAIYAAQDVDLAAGIFCDKYEGLEFYYQSNEENTDEENTDEVTAENGAETENADKADTKEAEADTKADEKKEDTATTKKK